MRPASLKLRCFTAAAFCPWREGNSVESRRIFVLAASTAVSCMRFFASSSLICSNIQECDAAIALMLSVTVAPRAISRMHTA